MMRSIAVMSRHSSGLRQYFPLPYSPSSQTPILVISLRRVGSFGAGAVNVSRSSINLRARYGGSFNPSKRLACSTSSVVTAVFWSCASAFMAWVSKVMKFSWTQDAVFTFTASSRSRASAWFMNCSASATVGLCVCAETPAQKSSSRKNIRGFIGPPVGIIRRTKVRCADEASTLMELLRLQSLNMFGYVLSAAALVAASAAGYQSMAPSGQWYGKTFTRLPRSTKKLALTYDDGPNDPYTLRLMEVLAKHDVRATFFCIGRYVQQKPKIARDLIGAGHVVGNHTYTHPNLALQSQTQVRIQLTTCQNVLGDVIGTAPKLFRPPYGGRRPSVLRIAREMGLDPIM